MRSTARARGSRWLIALIAVAVAVAVVGVVLRSERSPRLDIGPSVAADFRALASSTWDEFLDVFDGRRSCFGDVRLEADYALADRATYDPAGSTITVRVPGPGNRLQTALAHELAHHVEFQCPGQAELRSPFLEAQGLPAGTPWFEGDRWEDVPSEQYAEATARVVLGDRFSGRRVFISDAARRVILEWAHG
jgi:hypothetical protein